MTSQQFDQHQIEEQQKKLKEEQENKLKEQKFLQLKQNREKRLLSRFKNNRNESVFSNGKSTYFSDWQLIILNNIFFE